MRTAYRDDRVAADLVLLQAVQVSFELDFIKFTATGTPPALDWPVGKKHRQGARMTLHEVRLKDLARLPRQVLDSPLAAIELTTDLRLKAPPDDTREQLIALWRVQDLLYRRLRPWTEPEVGDRQVVLSSVRPKRRQLIVGVADTRVETIGGLPQVLVRGRDWGIDVDGAVKPPYHNEVGQLIKETAYWGQRTVDCWHDAGAVTVEAMAQVRLYIKVQDNRTMLPASRWSCRLEATVNGAYLRKVFNVETVGQLQTMPMRQLAARLWSLYQPKPVNTITRQREVAKRAGANPVYAAAIKAQDRSAYDRSVRKGTLAGAVIAGSERFAVVPDLTRPLLQGAADFNKKTRRDRTIAASATP